MYASELWVCACIPMFPKRLEAQFSRTIFITILEWLVNRSGKRRGFSGFPPRLLSGILQIF